MAQYKQTNKHLWWSDWVTSGKFCLFTRETVVSLKIFYVFRKCFTVNRFTIVVLMSRECHRLNHNSAVKFQKSIVGVWPLHQTLSVDLWQGRDLWTITQGSFPHLTICRADFSPARVLWVDRSSDSCLSDSYEDTLVSCTIFDLLSWTHTGLINRQVPPSAAVLIIYTFRFLHHTHPLTTIASLLATIQQ